MTLQIGKKTRMELNDRIDELECLKNSSQLFIHPLIRTVANVCNVHNNDKTTHTIRRPIALRGSQWTVKKKHLNRIVTCVQCRKSMGMYTTSLYITESTETYRENAMGGTSIDRFSEAAQRLWSKLQQKQGQYRSRSYTGVRRNPSPRALEPDISTGIGETYNSIPYPALYTHSRKFQCVYFVSLLQLC